MKKRDEKSLLKKMEKRQKKVVPEAEEVSWKSASAPTSPEKTEKKNELHLDFLSFDEAKDFSIVSKATEVADETN
jgi:hypothetical protein